MSDTKPGALYEEHSRSVRPCGERWAESTRPASATSGSEDPSQAVCYPSWSVDPLAQVGDVGKAMNTNSIDVGKAFRDGRKDLEKCLINFVQFLLYAEQLPAVRRERREVSELNRMDSS